MGVMVCNRRQLQAATYSVCIWRMYHHAVTLTPALTTTVTILKMTGDLFVTVEVWCIPRGDDGILITWYDDDGSSGGRPMK